MSLVTIMRFCQTEFSRLGLAVAKVEEEKEGLGATSTVDSSLAQKQRE